MAKIKPSEFKAISKALTPLLRQAEKEEAEAERKAETRTGLTPRRKALFDIEEAFEEIAEALPLEAFNRLLNVFDEYGRICAEEGAEEFGKEDSGILAQTLSEIFCFDYEI